MSPPPELINRPQDAPTGSSRLRVLGIAADAVAVTLAALAALGPTLGAHGSSLTYRLAYTPAIVAVTIVSIGLNKLYRARVCSVRALETATLLRAHVMALLVLAGVRNRLAPSLQLRHLVVAQVFSLMAVIVARSVYRGLLQRGRRTGRFMRPVVVVGTSDEAFEMVRLLQDEPELGYEVLGVVGDAADYERLHFEVPLLGSTDDVVSAVQRSGAGGAIVGVSSLDFRELNRVVRALLHEGIHVQVSGGLAGIAASRLRSNPIGREAAFYLEQVSLTGWQAWVKRGMDIVLGSLLVLPALPIIGILAILVKRTDGGPALFRQQRIGLDGNPFTILKLRTMVVDAEARLAELMRQNERKGPLFKMERDPRLTRIGRFMDATSLNELPQLFNVIRGDMSLVGPRPALAREVAEFDERLLIRHRVRPGITGLWQIESRDSPSFSDYERCDVFYVENWSVQLDLAILLQTFGAVLDRASSMFRRSSRDTDASPAGTPVTAAPAVAAAASTAPVRAAATSRPGDNSAVSTSKRPDPMISAALAMPDAIVSDPEDLDELGDLRVHTA